MRLFRRPRPANPQPSSPGRGLPSLRVPPPRYPFESVMDRYPGYYIWSTVAYMAPKLVAELKQIPNAGPAELSEVVEAAHAICLLGSELQDVDAELVKASQDELKWTFDEFSVWEERANRRGMMLRGPYVARHIFHYHPEDDGGKGHYRKAEARQWAQKSLSEPQLSEFLRLLERRAEIRDTAQQAFDGFLTLAEGIEAAHRKAQLVVSSGRLDADAGDAARPELALESLKDAENAVAAVNAGLDVAYPTAVVPSKPLARPRGVSPELGDSGFGR
jgi:hypothetical protein